ncbi:hypothetical protein ACHAWF_009721 [Thalassiosira exigua]
MRASSPISPPSVLLLLFSAFGPLLPRAVLGQCPNRCSSRGICNSHGACECADRFSGGDCSIRSCPVGAAFGDVASSTDAAHGDEVCSGKGTCVEGACVCEAGLTGVACERTKCKNDCSRRGQCFSMRYLADNARSLESQRYTYDRWDADKIFGCLCDLGYAGYDCSLRTCPTGDDPLTTTSTDQEVQLLRCTADDSSGGHLVLYFEGRASARVPVDASSAALEAALEAIPTINEVDVSYTEGSALCRDDGIDNIVRVTFVSNFGPLPPLVAEKFGMEPSSVVEVAADDSYGMLTDHNAVDHFHVKGNKEDDECSNRGICDQGTGTCQCFDMNGDAYAGSDGYGNAGDRGDCGHALAAPVTTCPGDPPCSGRGSCDPATMRCACEGGYAGGDCSLRTCPAGPAWFGYPSADDVAHDVEVECSNMGTCRRTVGECLCNDGFFGAACEYMGCPGGDEGPCGGRGTCRSVRELGLTKSSGPVVYGSDPNGAGTWDADRIYGCDCDEGFGGHDCSERTCVKGTDPSAAGDAATHACSNKGICDRETGRCGCFPGWGSSDGSGSLGPNNDCAHRLKLRGYP